LYELNVEFSPRSVFALHSAANAELAAGDTSSEAAALQRMLEITPNDQQAKNILEAVRRKP
jgi:predicted TPR repeat methyltransferase